MYPSPKVSISNSDGSHEAEEEAVLQVTPHVPVHSTSKSTCSPTVVEIALYKDVEINRDWLSDTPQDDAGHCQQGIVHPPPLMPIITNTTTSSQSNNYQQ